jgi:primosomal protein N' (replication factor Y)
VMLELTRWIGEYYLCSWGEALECAATPGVKVRSIREIELVPGFIDSGKHEALPERQRAIIDLLRDRGKMSLRQMERAFEPESVDHVVNALEKKGAVRTREVIRASTVRPRTQLFVLATTESPDAETLQSAPRQRQVLELLQNHGTMAVSELCRRAGVTMGTVRSLERKGFVGIESRERFRQPYEGLGAERTERFVLTEAQQRAFQAIIESVRAKQYKTFLLKGITGSGKTEIYMQVIDEALRADRGAIVLVPEIALTPQTVSRFRSRFHKDVAIFHSALSSGERYDEWRRTSSGAARIVVGARSAVFAPVPNLGVLVVDDEHEPSYKQDDTPHYHARDVAIMRARMESATVILGSATPSLESRFNVERGKYGMLELTERIMSRPLPTVKLVDMRTEIAEHKTHPIISTALQTELERVLDRGEQAIIFLNRRGYSPFLLCPKCGAVPTCRDCCVAMTYHSLEDMLICHYCNMRRNVPAKCSECGKERLIFVGIGTQKVQQRLRSLFPEAAIERMDLDTTRTKEAHREILDRFERGEMNILVGTQMVAKGLDYPGVTLVGVVSADTGLRLPDFRAAERTFQLLTQVSGRAGRGEEPGEVVVQTFKKEHYSVVAAQTHDYDSFYAKEIEFRRKSSYPPITHMVNLVFEGRDQRNVEKAAGSAGRVIRTAIRENTASATEVLGPAPGVLPRIRGRYRWRISVLGHRVGELQRLARLARDRHLEGRTRSSAKLKIDVDPYGII